MPYTLASTLVYAASALVSAGSQVRRQSGAIEPRGRRLPALRVFDAAAKALV